MSTGCKVCAFGVSGDRKFSTHVKQAFIDAYDGKDQARKFVIEIVLSSGSEVHVERGLSWLPVPLGVYFTMCT